MNGFDKDVLQHIWKAADEHPPTLDSIGVAQQMLVYIHKGVAGSEEHAEKMGSLKEGLDGRCPQWGSRWGGWLEEMREAINDERLEDAQDFVKKMENEISKSRSSGVTRPGPHLR